MKSKASSGKYLSTLENPTSIKLWIREGGRLENLYFSFSYSVRKLQAYIKPSQTSMMGCLRENS